MSLIYQNKVTLLADTLSTSSETGPNLLLSLLIGHTGEKLANQQLRILLCCGASKKVGKRS